MSCVLCSQSSDLIFKIMKVANIVCIFKTSRLIVVASLLQVVTLLVPLRYDIVQLGGSWAQRQVFSITLIQAAIKAGKLKLAQSLITELKVYIWLWCVNILFYFVNVLYYVSCMAVMICVGVINAVSSLLHKWTMTIVFNVCVSVLS